MLFGNFCLAHFSIKREQVELILIKESLFLTSCSLCYDIIWLVWKKMVWLLHQIATCSSAFFYLWPTKKKQQLLPRRFPFWLLIFLYYFDTIRYQWRGELYFSNLHIMNPVGRNIFAIFFRYLQLRILYCWVMCNLNLMTEDKGMPNSNWLNEERKKNGMRH